VADGDLVAAGDKKSAVMTGHLAGTGVIHAPISGLTGTDSGTLTINASPPPPSPPPSGSGGFGGGPSAPTSIAGVTDLSSIVNSQGVLNMPVISWSNDKMAVLVIGDGTKALDSTGAPLTQISILHMTTPPVFPSGAGMVTLAYEFQPSGATFNPQTVVRFQYDPKSIPDGVAEKSLQIAYYDSSTGNWITLMSEVDVNNHFITASIAHFTPYAVTYGVKVVTPVPATTPVMITTTPIVTTAPTTTPIVITTSTKLPMVTPTATTTPTVTATVTGIGTVDVSNDLTADGKFIEPVILNSTDNNSIINIPAGIRGTTSKGLPLSSITVTQVSGTLALLPAGENVVSAPYEFGPSGAQFSSPISMIFSYDPTKITSGFPETSLAVAYYNVSEKQWISIRGIVDTVNHTITVQVDHFTAFAVIQGVTATTPTTPKASIPLWLFWTIVVIVAIVGLISPSVVLWRRRTPK